MSRILNFLKLVPAYELERQRLETLKAEARNRILETNNQTLVKALKKSVDELKALKAEIDLLRQESTNLNRLIRENEEAVFRAQSEIASAEAVKVKCADIVRQSSEELVAQSNLNAELLQQGFGITVDAERHTLAINPNKIQVLTQINERQLDLPRGLFEAVLNPFAINVAKHLINKLYGRGCLTAARDANAVNVASVLLGKKPELLDSSRTPLQKFIEG